MTNAIDTHISIQQWIALSGQLDVRLGALTPLFSAEKIAGFTHPETTVVPGAPLPDLSTFFNQLANPQAVNGLSFILRDCVIDLAVFYPADSYLTSVISLSEENDTLRLQCPAPIDEVLDVLQSQLGEAKSEASPVELEIPVLPAWLCWAFIDLQREAMAGDGSLQDLSFQLDAIMAVLGRPFELLDNLGAYYRQALDLDIPMKKDVQSALRMLTGKGLIESTPAGFKPGSLLCEQALELSDLGAHMMLKTSALLPDGSVGTLRNFIFQGKSGNGLLWFNNNGTVSFLGLSPAQIIYLVEKVMKEPLQFFGQAPGRGPSSEKSAAPKGPRRPPPPERLS